jgi:hypothetical protein
MLGPIAAAQDILKQVSQASLGESSPSNKKNKIKFAALGIKQQPP